MITNKEEKPLYFNTESFNTISDTLGSLEFFKKPEEILKKEKDSSDAKREEFRIALDEVLKGKETNIGWV